MGQPRRRGKSPSSGAWSGSGGEAYLQVLIHEFPKREAKSFFGRDPAEKLVGRGCNGENEHVPLPRCVRSARTHLVIISISILEIIYLYLVNIL